MTSAPRSASSMPAKGPARMCPTSRILMPASGPDDAAVTARSELGTERREKAHDALAGLDARGTVPAEREDAHGQVRDARVAEAAEPVGHLGLVAGGEHVADVGGVTVLEQPLV